MYTKSNFIKVTVHNELLCEFIADFFLDSSGFVYIGFSEETLNSEPLRMKCCDCVMTEIFDTQVTNVRLVSTQ